MSIVSRNTSRTSLNSELLPPPVSARSLRPKLSQLSQHAGAFQKAALGKDEPSKSNPLAHPLLDWFTQDVKKRLVAIDRKLDLLPIIERRVERLAQQPHQAGTTPTSEEQSTTRAPSESGVSGRASISPGKFRRRSQSVPHLTWYPTLAPLDNGSECGSRRTSKRFSRSISENGSTNGDETSIAGGSVQFHKGEQQTVTFQKSNSSNSRGNDPSPKHAGAMERSSDRSHSSRSFASVRGRLDFLSAEKSGASSNSLQVIQDIATTRNGQNSAIVPVDVSPEPSASGESKGSVDVKDMLRASVPSTHRSMGAGSQRVWNFLEDPNSSMYAFIYASTIPTIIMVSVFTSLLQTTEPPVLSGLGAAIMETIIDCIFAIEICVRFVVYPSHVAFFFSIQNLIDVVVALPLILRVWVGFEIHPSSEAGWEREFLLCVVPMLRLLKMMRRFEKFHLLLKAMEVCTEALPVMLFTLLVIAWIFSSLIYFVEPRSNIDSFPRAMWLTIVTMTTVGYGDVVPKSSGGSTIVAMLVISSVLYMAMPIGIIGHAFTQIWVDRDQILLKHRTRDVFDKWGYTASDISQLFRLFDEDGSGNLSLNEFRKMIERMSIGLSDKRIVQLFEAFEDKAHGIIDERAFVRMLFPSSYHDLYANAERTTRRVSWMPIFGNLERDAEDEAISDISEECDEDEKCESQEVPSVVVRCGDAEMESIDSEIESVKSSGLKT